MRSYTRGSVLLLCCLAAVTNAQPHGAVIVERPMAAAISPNAFVSTSQELHPFKARFERQRARDVRRSGGSLEPNPTVSGDTITLPTIEISGGENEAPNPSEDTRLRKAVRDAFGENRLRVGLGGGQQVINGSPLSGVAWQAWTNPGNIQFGLR